MLRKFPVRIAILVVLGLALMTTALVMAENDDVARDAVAQDPDLPGADGAMLLDYVLNQNPYTDWGSWTADRWTDFDAFLQSGAPHGETVRIFANHIAQEGVMADGFDGTLPYGSIVVKENYGGTVEAPGELAALTIQYKVEGYNPAAGDWFWVKASGDGSVIDAEGMVEGCINCHGQDGNADYLLRYAFGEEPVVTYSDPLPAGDGAAILDYIINTSTYTEWSSFPAQGDLDFSGYLASNSPHGSSVRIFVNDRALDAIARDTFDGTLPPGSVVVKEGFEGTVDAPGEVAAITLMYKVDGFNPEANDWYWVAATADGSAVNVEGMVDGCIDCHGQDGNSDYLLAYDLPEGAMMGDEMMDDEMMEDESMDEEMMDEPALDGEALVAQRCTTCHTIDRINNANYDRAGWDSTVARMEGYGAQLDAAERAAVLDYLASR
ncbi:MAG: hypothetical protein GYB65_18045 [Chloroflexi bacterium]|nr:hypothetical protein [Chloroflexota bacterium]